MLQNDDDGDDDDDDDNDKVGEEGLCLLLRLCFV